MASDGRPKVTVDEIDMTELEDVPVVAGEYKGMPEPGGEERQSIKRIVKLTEKDIEYRFCSLENRWGKLYNQLMGKSSAVHNLYYSRDYFTTVKGEFQIFHDLLT